MVPAAATMEMRAPGSSKILAASRALPRSRLAKRRSTVMSCHSIRSRSADSGGDRAAFMYTLIVTAKMNDVDPQAWLADVLARTADHPSQRLDELLPWNWKKTGAAGTLAA